MRGSFGTDLKKQSDPDEHFVFRLERRKYVRKESIQSNEKIIKIEMERLHFLF